MQQQQQQQQQAVMLVHLTAPCYLAKTSSSSSRLLQCNGS
jgi:hypothetical protein